MEEGNYPSNFKREFKSFNVQYLFVYKLRNFVNSVRRNFDPNGYIGEEGLFSIVTGGTGVTAAYLALDHIQKSQATLPATAQLYAGAIVTAASIVFFIDDTLFNSKLLRYILERV